MSKLLFGIDPKKDREAFMAWRKSALEDPCIQHIIHDAWWAAFHARELRESCHSYRQKILKWIAEYKQEALPEAKTCEKPVDGEESEF